MLFDFVRYLKFVIMSIHFLLSKYASVLFFSKSNLILLYPYQMKLGGDVLEPSCPSVRMSKFWQGHNFQSVMANNLKLHTLIEHIIEKCSA